VKELPTGPTGRALAVAITLLGVAIFYFLVISPILGYYEDQAAIVERRTELAERSRSLAQQLPELRTADKKWRDQFGGDILLTGQSDAEASAAIQGMMKQNVEDAGSKLASAEVLPEKTEGDFRRVGIRVTFEGDLKLVSAVLKNIEIAHPVLVAGDFDMHSGTSQDDSSTTGAGSEGLTVTLDVYGFRAG
jgi:hypothetical protein